MYHVFLNFKLICWIKSFYAAKSILEKNVQNLTTKYIFARWQDILFVLYFDIKYIKGNSNTFLQEDSCREDKINKKESWNFRIFANSSPSSLEENNPKAIWNYSHQAITIEQKIIIASKKLPTTITRPSQPKYRSLADYAMKRIP